MKFLIKLVAVLVVILVVVVLALQVFLNRGLNPVVQKALPKVKDQTGLNVAVEHVSLNLFQGALRVGEVRVGNPQSFDEPSVLAVERTVLDVSMKSLLKGILEVSEATVKDAKITLVRNKEGAVNLSEIQKSLPKAEPKETAEAPVESAPQTTPAEPMEMPKVLIHEAAFNTLFEFIDHKTTNGSPRSVGFDLALLANDLKTFGSQPEEEWGQLKITGALKENPNAFATDISARIAPVTDPSKISLNAEGKIIGIDMRELGSVSEDAGIVSDNADIRLTLKVRDGVFLSGSELTASMQNAKLAGEQAKKHKDVKLPPDISLTIPVTGTLNAPVINWQQAITTSLLRNFAKNPDYLLDNVSVDGKSLRDRLKKALGDDKKTDNKSEEKSEGEDDTEKNIREAVKGLGELFK